MKKTANIVIIGGGIVGCAIAAELSKKIQDVVLIERNGISSQASGANFGMVWIQTRFPGYDVTMVEKTKSIYEELIEEDFDLDIEYEKVGGLTVGYSEAQLEAMKWQCKRKQSYGFPVSMLDREDTLRLEPNLSPQIIGSIFCGEDVQLNPYLTTMAFANLAKRRGVEINTYTEVIGIEHSGGEIKSVKTNRGSISTSLVINATGCWGREIAKMIGVDLPIYPQRLQALVTEPLPKLVRRVVQVARDITEEEARENPEKATGFAFEYEGNQTEENLPKLPVEETIFTYLKPTKSGTIGIGTTNEFVGYNKKSSPEGMVAMLKGAARICPALKNAKIIRSWANLVPFTYDGLPVIGELKEIKGFIMAAGHAHAMSHAPAVAVQLSDFITEGRRDKLMDDSDIRRFDLERNVGE
jgi:glycine/D-amino acid oxidase-like deaminating enzyme